MGNNVEYILSLRDLFSSKIQAATANCTELDGKLNHLKSTANGVGGSFSNLGGHIKTALIGFASFESIKGIVKTTAELQAMRNSINISSVDAKDAAANQQYLADVIDRMKLPMKETMEGFQMFSASLVGSKLQGQGARDVFEGVSTAISALHLPADKAYSVFYALNNMMSMGTVHAQDMKMQLGNALPGALQLAANSMHMTIQQFNTAMEKGLIVSADFLPKFSQLLQEHFQKGLQAARESLQGGLNAMGTAWTKFQEKLGTENLGAINSVLEKTTSFIEFLSAHTGVFQALAIGIGSVAGILLVYNSYIAISKALTIAWGVVTGIYTAFQWLQVASTYRLVDAWRSLNVVMKANPMGLIFTAIVAVGGAIMYLWNTSEKFRGFLFGLWEAVKQVFTNIWEAGKKYLGGLGELLVGIFTLDISKIKSGLSDAFGGMKDVYTGAGKGASEAFRNGFMNGQNDFRLSKNSSSLADQFKGKGAQGKGVAGPGSKSGIGSGAIGEVTGKGPQTVNISIKSLIENQTIQTVNMKEGSSEIKAAVTKVLLEALGDVQIALR